MLIYRVLGLGHAEFFLIGITRKEVFELGVRNEARSHLVDMLSFSSLLIEFLLEVNGAENSRLDMAGINFETESSKTSEVDALNKALSLNKTNLRFTFPEVKFSLIYSDKDLKMTWNFET